MGDHAICGLLLAAGRGTRFGGEKLLASLPGNGDTIAVGVAAYRSLRAAIPHTLVVVRAHDAALPAVFAREGARIVRADRADCGMGESLAAGVGAAREASGYVIALADMPWVAVATITRIVDALALGASIVAPSFGGRRGHPVGFASSHRDALLALRGDAGARSIIDAHRGTVSLIDVDDAGILRDVDTPIDLAGY
jgi:molybdenum cofactor cytidylyltransferase